MMKYKGMYLRLFSVILRKPMMQQYGRELTREALKKAPAKRPGIKNKRAIIPALSNNLELKWCYVCPSGG